MRKTTVAFSMLLTLLIAKGVSAGDWPSWRGPYHTGVSPETGLISDWSQDGKNLIWRADFVGRSTPVVLNGKVYVLGRTGEGKTMQRVVACYSAEDGKLIWEEKSNVFHTTIPFVRVGWASLGGDQETGNVYAFGVDGLLTCYNGETGAVIWRHSLVEEYHRFSGYGGRTVTPLVDDDLVHISFWTWSAWGEKGPPHPRYHAYDKRTGELVWKTALKSTPNNTNYSNPVFTVLNGIRTMITGGPDGAIYAFKARTGDEIWKFQLSKGAIQTSVVVDGDKVFASHSAENIDNASFGRIVCINANGSGDITKTNEVWRYDAIDVGYASPLIHEGRLYVVTNAGNLMALNAPDGKVLWTFNLGTVGKGSPVWADGKIFATEVNGAFHIVEPGDKSAKSLDREVIPFDEKRPAEIYSSPAIAYKRIFFATEKGLFCLGDETEKFEMTGPTIVTIPEPASPSSGPVQIQIVPAETWIRADEAIDFSVRAYDDLARTVGGELDVSFSLDGLVGAIDNDGNFRPDQSAGVQAGYVVAKIGEMESQARVQVTPGLPLGFDFEDFAVDKNPPYWPNASKFMVKKLEGQNVLMKPPSNVGLNRHNLFLAPPEMSGYVIQADMKAEKVKRSSPDMGLISHRYYLDFMTKKKRLQIRSWPAELERLMVEKPFEWNPELWYTMKLRVDIKDGKAVVKGKVWPKGESEPDAWTITAEDPIAHLHGSPGLYGDTPTNVYFDNVKITKSE